jgi:hypothetical protein
MTTSDPAFLERLRAATALLEEIVADRSLLVGVPPDDQRRLLQAAGHVYSPDAIARRQLVQATIRERKATKVRREDQVLDATGIRALRRQPVYTSPNVFPPAPALPAVRRVQVRQAHRDGRPHGPGGAAHRRAGQDRLPGRHQAAPGRRPADRHHPLPPRLGGALRPGAGLQRLGRTARDLRARPPTHAER